MPVLYGFAAWQAVDVIGFHWLVGIHRVRVDVPNPLFWDVAWLVAFGVPPLLAAWSLHRRPPGGGTRATAAVLAAVTVAAGTWAAWPNDAQAGSGVVVFAPGTSAAAAFDALARQDARVRWVDASGGVWAVEWARAPSAWELLRSGAVLAGNTATALGCVGWIAAEAPAVNGAARP